MGNYLIGTVKSWNIENFKKLKESDKNNEWHLIEDELDLNYEKIKKINPKYIFFPHWSWIIPKEIYEDFNCVVFHMTDVPFGRGGSPLQNLISRGVYKTKISAIKVAEKIDSGDVYCKEPLSLEEGGAEEIFKRASNIIFNKMIPFIIKNNPTPKKQEGDVIRFKRRTPEQSDISELDDLNKVYDYIRMLDGEGYPKAFIESKKLKFEFSAAKLKKDCIEAKVSIKRK